MALTAREMTVAETDLVIDYFHNSTPEYLETLGVDPSRMPSRESWRERLALEFARPVEQRAAIVVIWLSDDRPSAAQRRYLFRTAEAEAAIL